jgi:DNA-directed RNA polymerase specialized sigma24 family protein
MSDPFLLYLERPTRQRYTQLVLAYAGPVERIVRRLVPSAAADDIIQETFLALAATKRKRDEIRNPRSFVLQTAVQLARNQKRGAPHRAPHREKALRAWPPP